MPVTLTTPEFIPQTVIPPEKPLPLIRGLLQTIVNPLHERRIGELLLSAPGATWVLGTSPRLTLGDQGPR